MPSNEFYELEYYKRKLLDKEKAEGNSNIPQQPNAVPSHRATPVPNVTYVYHISTPYQFPVGDSFDVHHAMTRQAAITNYMNDPTGFNPIDFYNRIDAARRRGSLGL